MSDSQKNSGLDDSANQAHRLNHSIAEDGDRSTFPELQPFESPVPEQGRKDKYLSEVANIEDLPGEEDVFPHRTNEGAPAGTNTGSLVDDMGQKTDSDFNQLNAGDTNEEEKQ